MKLVSYHFNNPVIASRQCFAAVQHQLPASPPLHPVSLTLHLRCLQVEDEEYQLKPMNCPFHVTVYKNGYHSYRDLPIRLAELGTVYRSGQAPCGGALYTQLADDDV